MLWELLQVLILLGLVSAILSFSKSQDTMGKIFWHFISAITNFGTGVAMLKIRFMAGGDVGMIFYDFTLGSSASGTGIVWIWYAMGFMMLIFGFIRAWMVVIKGQIEGYEELTGKKGSKFLTNMDID